MTEFMTHELRHADQFFRAAIATASESGSADEIVEDLDIQMETALRNLETAASHTAMQSLLSAYVDTES